MLKGKVIQIQSHGDATHLYALTDEGNVYEYDPFSKTWLDVGLKEKPHYAN